MIINIERQAYDGSWHHVKSFEDKGLAQKELAHLNDLLINGKPHATYRLSENS